MKSILTYIIAIYIFTVVWSIFTVFYITYNVNKQIRYFCKYNKLFTVFEARSTIICYIMCLIPIVNVIYVIYSFSKMESAVNVLKIKTLLVNHSDKVVDFLNADFIDNPNITMKDIEDWFNHH